MDPAGEKEAGFWDKRMKSSPGGGLFLRMPGPKIAMSLQKAYKPAGRKDGVKGTVLPGRPQVDQEQYSNAGLRYGIFFNSSFYFFSNSFAA